MKNKEMKAVTKAAEVMAEGTVGIPENRLARLCIDSEARQYIDSEELYDVLTEYKSVSGATVCAITEAWEDPDVAEVVIPAEEVVDIANSVCVYAQMYENSDLDEDAAFKKSMDAVTKGIGVKTEEGRLVARTWQHRPSTDPHDKPRRAQP